MVRIFFYGLFMDRALLMRQDLEPRVVGPAVLNGYRIHVGERATLVRADGGRALGIVMDITPDEASALYSEASVRDYVPETVAVDLLDSGETVDAECYNLPPGQALAGTNPEYARKLARLAGALGFDPAYVREVAAFGVDGSGGGADA